jgi:lipopolysaccharide biosynthesis glycosyltransferase
MAVRTDPIQIAFAADAGYAMPLAVAICSAAANCDRKRALRFNIFHSDIDEELQEKIETSLENAFFPDARIDWIEVDIARLSKLKLSQRHINHLTYVRIIMPELIASGIDRVLYLDSDIVVTGNLGDLWDTDIGSKTLGAVRDRMGTVSARTGLLKYKELGIDADAKYFNAGVLLVDLERWRRLDVTRRVLDYLEHNREFVQMGDQDGLNAVLHDDWSELDFRWNWQVVPDMQKARESGCWGLEKIDKSIVHFVTAVKPWLPSCNYPERTLFFRYLDRTLWSGWRVPFWKEQYASLKDIVRTTLPRKGQGQVSPQRLP